MSTIQTTAKSDRGQNATIALYIGGLGLTWGLTRLANIPVQFFLKEHLHLTASGVAQFGFLTGIPNYLGFLFGFVRDRWHPLRRGDRGYLLLFSPLIMLLYLWMATGRLSYERLLFTILTGHTIRQLLDSAYQGLMASVAQSRLMPGRLSVLSNLIAGVPLVLSMLYGGWLTENLTTSQIFQLVAFLFLLLTLFGLWKPASVYTGMERRYHNEDGFLSEVRRLIHHRPLWPVVGIAFLANFMPGFGTPLLFFLTNTLKLTSTQYGVFNALLQASFAPTIALHGLLCRRISMARLLPLAMIIMLPQVVPLLFIHNPNQALACGVLMGLTGGMAVVTINDAMMRACPEGLEGTAMMLLAATLTFASASSDVVGAWLYERGGFSWCVIATTLAYALIFPLIPLIPRSVLATRDGEALPKASPEIDNQN